MNHKINLFIHDSFFDAFSLLPKQIQKKTREFMKKFREDPTSGAINYEKICTFKDQSLRTVRIDQKYRAIIQVPALGNGYHLLWVDNHDEAMDWAKNKVFEWNANTQSFQMYDYPAASVGIAANRPISLLNELTDKELLAIGIPPILIDLVRKVSSIADLEKIRENLPSDSYEYLFYMLEGLPFEDILEEINEGKNAADESTSNNAQKNVYLLTEDDDLEKVLSGDFEKWKLFLHPTQRSLAYRDYNGPVKVTGGAGTGKTVCALHRAKYLVNKIEIFQKPLLFTTYTKSLTNYLRETVKGFNLPKENIVIENFDKLVLSIAKDASYRILPDNSGFLNESQEREIWKEVLEFNPSKYDEDFLITEYAEVILKNSIVDLEQYLKTSRIGRMERIGRKDKMEIWKLIEDYRNRKGTNYSKLELCNILTSHFSIQSDKPFSHIICDELQDFTNVELGLMRTLVEEKSNDLFFVGDPFQNIYGRLVKFSMSNINIKGKRSKKLKVNYRTTEEIRKTAVRLITNDQFDNFDDEAATDKGYISLMHGNDPVYQVFNTPEAEEKYIIEKITELLKQEEINPSDVCICARTNHLLDQVKMLLNRNELKYTDISSFNISTDSIRVSTFHNLKGHEFKFLFVTGVSQSLVPFKHPGYADYDEMQREQYHKSERALYYVVFTRAIQGLFITGVGEESDWVL